jgi:hypothetical protein
LNIYTIELDEPQVILNNGLRFFIYGKIIQMREYRPYRWWINNKQTIVLWITGVFLSLGVIFCHFDLRYDYPDKVPVSYNPLKRNDYRISGVRNWYYGIRISHERYSLLLVSILLILIIEGLLIYRLHDKEKKTNAPESGKKNKL